MKLNLVANLINKVTLRTDDMDLAGDIVQSLAEFLGIEVSVPVPIMGCCV